MSTITPPDNLNYGKVVWRVGVDVNDTDDLGSKPDLVPPTGYVTFVSSVGKSLNPTATPDPLTMLKYPIVGVIDEQGYLCTPDLTAKTTQYPKGTPAYRGVELIATDDPDLNPLNPTYIVEYVLKGPDGVRMAYPEAHKISVPSDTIVDLTNFLPPDNQQAIGIPQATAMAARAEAAAVAADERADAAEASAALAASKLVNSDTFVATKVVDNTSATGAAVAAKIGAGVDELAVTKPGGSIAEFAVASRRSSEADGYAWTTKEETVARALGWTIVTDARWAGGAKMDGVTDDTAALSAAVANGGTIWVPAGTLLVTGKVTASQAYTSIRGAGKRASVLKTNTDVEILEVTGNYSTVQNVMFQNTLVGRTKFALKFTDTNQGEVFGCYFGSADGGRVWGVWFSGGSMGLVDGCTFSHAQIRIETWDTKVTRSWVWGMSCDYAIGIFGGAGNTSLSNVDIVPPLLSTSTGLAGIYIDGASGKSFNTSLTDIYLDGNPSLVTRRGIYIGDGSGSVLMTGIKANKLDAEAVVIDSAYSVTINGYIGQGNNQSGNGSSEIKILQSGAQPTENIRIIGASFLQTAAVTGTAGAAIEVDAAVAADQVSIESFDVKQPAAGGGYTVPEIKVPVVSNYPTQSMVGRGKLTKYRALGSVAVASGDTGKTILFSDSFGFAMAYRPRPSQIQLMMESAGQTLPAYRITYTNDNQIYVAFASSLTAAGTLHWRVDLRR